MRHLLRSHGLLSAALLCVLTACSQEDTTQNPDGGGPLGPTPTCTDKVNLAAFDVDVPAVTLSGRITVGGKVPTSPAAAVLLRDPRTGDTVSLGRTGDTMYTPKLIVPGTYELIYAYNGQNDTGDVPRNTRALLRSGVEVKASGALDVDISAVTLSGKITVNGQAVMSNSGSVTLRAREGGDSVYLGRTGDAMYTPKLLIAGTYDVVYSYSSSGAGAVDVPRNTAARLKSGVEVKQSGALDVDIPAVGLSGKLTVAGKTPTSGAGSVTLRSGTDTVFLGTTGDAMYVSKLVVPGSYDVVYSYGSGGAGVIDVPRNTAARLKTGVELKQSGALDVDIPAVTLSGKVTVNGGVVTSTAGAVSLREATARYGDTVFLGRTGEPAYVTKLIVPGTYDLFYAYSAGGGMIDVPRNTGARIKAGVELTQSGALDADVPAILVSGKITVNGQVPMNTAGSVLLRDVKAGDSVALGRTGDATYAAKLVVPGTYDVFYSYSSSAAGLIDIPRNTSGRVKTGVALTANGALDVDVPAVSVVGKVTVAGQTPMAQNGQVTLGNPSIADTVFLGRTGDPTYAAKLVLPAPYNVVYGWTGASDPVNDVPRNSAALLGCKLLAP